MEILDFTLRFKNASVEEIDAYLDALKEKHPDAKVHIEVDGCPIPFQL